jgi:hypothetical protein
MNSLDKYIEKEEEKADKLANSIEVKEANWIPDVVWVNPEIKATRVFNTGASRNSDEGKFDYDGFLSPTVLKSYAEYMHKMRYLEDGTMRDSDNWQKGIPKSQYMKSMWRHFMDVWTTRRDGTTSDGSKVSPDDKIEQLNALLFNVMGLLHEELKDA